MVFVTGVVKNLNEKRRLVEEVIKKENFAQLNVKMHTIEK